MKLVLGVLALVTFAGTAVAAEPVAAGSQTTVSASSESGVVREIARHRRHRRHKRHHRRHRRHHRR